MPDPTAPSQRIAQGELIREVLSSFTDVMRAEVELARTELQESVHQAQEKLTRTAIFGFLCGMGIFPLLAFLVIGLGSLLNENYWLSSLITGVILVAGGGFLAVRAFRGIREAPLDLPETRRSLNEEARMIEGKITRIADTTRRKSA